VSVLADDPKGRFDIRSLPGQVFWFWIAILAVNIAGKITWGHDAGWIGVPLYAPPMLNVGAALASTLFPDRLQEEAQPTAAGRPFNPL
jgi:hypothetical protein